MPPTPVVKAFLLADSVLQDRATGKWTVVGIFDRLLAAAFPCVHPNLAIYVKLADAQGRYRVRLEFRDSEDRLVTSLEGIELEVPDRLKTFDFGLPTSGLRLEKPGRYQFQLCLNGEYAAAVSLDVLPIPPPAPRPPP